MKSIRNLISRFQVARAIIPLWYLILFSFLYNLVYIFSNNMGFIFDINYSYLVMLIYAIQIIANLLFGLGLYFVCTRAWGKKEGAFKMNAIVHVLVIQAFWILLVGGIIQPMYVQFINSRIIQIILALASAVLIIFMVPLTLIYFYGVYSGIDSFGDLLRYTGTVMRKHYRSILNWFAGLFLFIVLLDTIMGGVFSAASGFNAADLVSRILFMGNPMMSWMLFLFLGVVSGQGLGSFIVYTFGLFILGYFYGLLEINYVFLIQKECAKEDGNRKAQTDKKKI